MEELSFREMLVESKKKLRKKGNKKNGLKLKARKMKPKQVEFKTWSKAQINKFRKSQKGGK